MIQTKSHLISEPLNNYCGKAEYKGPSEEVLTAVEQLERIFKSKGLFTIQTNSILHDDGDITTNITIWKNMS